MTQQAIERRKPTEELVRYDTIHGEVALSVSYVQQYFCAEATPQEAFAFLKVCQFHKLNPYLREVYLVKFGKDPAQIILGYQAWTQRAEQDRRYQGFKAGIILKNGEGLLEHREGAFYLDHETLVGGWCQVFLTHRPEPVMVELALHEYIQRNREGRPNKFWTEKPGTMIRKCAVAQCHREAFPSLFGGLYDKDEVAQGAYLPEDAVVIDGQSHPVEAAARQADPEVESIEHQGRVTFTGDAQDVESRRTVSSTELGNDAPPEDPPQADPELFDPEQEPVPPLPETVHSKTHFQEILRNQDWTVARLEIEVLGVALDTWLKTNTLDQAYQAWREQAGV